MGVVVRGRGFPRLWMGLVVRRRAVEDQLGTNRTYPARVWVNAGKRYIFSVSGCPLSVVDVSQVKVRVTSPHVPCNPMHPLAGLTKVRIIQKDRR